MSQNISRNTKPHRVIIVDFMNYDSCVEVPYLFTRAGCHVTVFCDEQSWLIQNSFFDTQIVPISKNPEEYLQHLKQTIHNGNYDYVCPVDDAMIRLLDESRGSKAHLARFCKTNNFLTPDFVIENIHDPAITFPVLLKVDKSQGGKGVFLCRDKDQMMDTYTRLSDQEKKDLVIQKYIDGENVGIEAFFDNGKLTAYAFSRIEKTVRGEFGVSSERTYLSCPGTLESEITRFGKLFGTHGFASITFMHERDTDNYYLIEFDSRTNAWLRHAQFVAVDFSRAIRASLDHEQIFLRPMIAKPKILWHFPRDVISAFFARDIKTFLKWAINYQNRWRMVPWYDLKLIGSIIVRAGWSIYKRVKVAIIN